MKSIMSFSQDNQKILVHALVSFRKTRDESDCRDLSYKVVSLALKELAVIYPVLIVMGEVYTYFLVKGIYAI